jgi:hypothetical protein
MERGGGDPPRSLLTEQIGEAQSQLAGRPDAERDSEDLVRLRLL